MKREDIDRVLAELKGLQCKTQKEVEEARVRFLGRKGEITALFEEFRTVDKEMKREFGRTLNELKNAAQETIDRLRDNIGEEGGSEGPKQDLSMPGDPLELGSRHPVSIVRQEIVDIFRKFGYDVAEGPEVEDDYHVFEALNFPPNHPARDMQDTFFVSTGHPNPLLLRTHTSSVQVRTMERMKNPPIRVICPGRVFRNEAISARAHCIFHQVEGLYTRCSVPRPRSACGRPSSPSRSRPPRWTSAATSAMARVATSARERAGWRSWAAAWWTRTSSRPAGSTPRNTAASPSAWAWSASRCSSGGSTTCATTLRTICASSRSSTPPLKFS